MGEISRRTGLTTPKDSRIVASPSTNKESSP
nr:MAG TPA: hypothetical protein [Caudoviricetes sp.]